MKITELIDYYKYAVRKLQLGKWECADLCMYSKFPFILGLGVGLIDFVQLPTFLLESYRFINHVPIKLLMARKSFNSTTYIRHLTSHSCVPKVSTDYRHTNGRCVITLFRLRCISLLTIPQFMTVNESKLRTQNQHVIKITECMFCITHVNHSHSSQEAAEIMVIQDNFSPSATGAAKIKVVRTGGYNFIRAVNFR